jgi:hypothetical protein
VAGNLTAKLLPHLDTCIDLNLTHRYTLKEVYIFGAGLQDAATRSSVDLAFNWEHYLPRKMPLKLSRAPSERTNTDVALFR